MKALKINEIILSNNQYKKLRIQEDSAVGIRSGGRGGYGSGNMTTPQSRRGYAQQREEDENEEEWLDLEDLSGEFMDEGLSFKRGDNPYKALHVSDYRPYEIGDKIVLKDYVYWYDKLKDGIGKWFIKDEYIDTDLFRVIWRPGAKFTLIQHKTLVSDTDLIFFDKNGQFISKKWVENHPDIVERINKK